MDNIIYTKQEIGWHVIHHYLDSISAVGMVQRDKDFCKLFSAMQSYVDKKLEFNGDGDVIDYYVVVLQHAEE